MNFNLISLKVECTEFFGVASMVWTLSFTYREKDVRNDNLIVFVYASEMYVRNIHFMRTSYQIRIKFTTLKFIRDSPKTTFLCRIQVTCLLLTQSNLTVICRQRHLRRRIFLLGNVTLVFFYKLQHFLYLYRRQCDFYPWR